MITGKRNQKQRKSSVGMGSVSSTIEDMSEDTLANVANPSIEGNVNESEEEMSRQSVLAYDEVECSPKQKIVEEAETEEKSGREVVAETLVLLHQKPPLTNLFRNEDAVEVDSQGPQRTETIETLPSTTVLTDDPTSALTQETLNFYDDSSKGEMINGEGNIAVDNIPHPYVGKLVRILKGALAGMEARILVVKTRGWWLVETQDGRRRLTQHRSCCMIDHVSKAEMKNYYSSRSLKQPARKGATLKRILSTKRDRIDNHWDGTSSAENAAPSHLALENNLSDGESYDMNDAQGVDGEREESSESDSKRSMLETGGIDGMDEDGFSRVMPCLNSRSLREEQLKRPKWNVLPPLSISAVGRVDRLPRGLNHLGSTTLLKIFDRKTGKILEGDHAVQVQHLSSVLQEHPEYEPIIPPPNINDDQPFMRKGRSGRRIRVNSEIIPQRKIIASKCRGRVVTITDGPHCGCKATIHSILEGRWYVLDGVLPDLQLIISHNSVNMDSQHPERASAQTLPQQMDHQVCTEFVNAISGHFHDEVKDIRTQIKDLADEEKTLLLELEHSVADDSLHGSNLLYKQQQKQLDYIRKCRKELEKEELALHSTVNIKTVGLALNSFTNVEPK